MTKDEYKFVGPMDAMGNMISDITRRGINSMTPEGGVKPFQDRPIQALAQSTPPQAMPAAKNKTPVQSIAAQPQVPQQTQAPAVQQGIKLPKGVMRNAAGAIDSKQVSNLYNATAPKMVDVPAYLPQNIGAFTRPDGGVQHPSYDSGQRSDYRNVVGAANAAIRSNKQNPDIANLENASRGINITKTVGKDGRVEFHDRTANPYIDQKFTANGGAYTGREIGDMNRAISERTAQEARLRELPTIAKYYDENAIPNAKGIADLRTANMQNDNASAMSALQQEWLAAVQSGDEKAQAMVIKKLNGLNPQKAAEKKGYDTVLRKQYGPGGEVIAEEPYTYSRDTGDASQGAKQQQAQTTFASEAEADLAKEQGKIKPGDTIFIGGKKATVD